MMIVSDDSYDACKKMVIDNDLDLILIDYLKTNEQSSNYQAVRFHHHQPWHQLTSLFEHIEERNDVGTEQLPAFSRLDPH